MDTEMISVPREKFEKMEAELNELREQIKEVNSSSQEEMDVVEQLEASMEDLKHGRFRKVA
tara:strand:- start:122 stop:304 length:183 start_codon:yes stop_codon:yes gene_type:complete